MAKKTVKKKVKKKAVRQIEIPPGGFRAKKQKMTKGAAEWGKKFEAAKQVNKAADGTVALMMAFTAEILVIALKNSLVGNAQRSADESLALSKNYAAIIDARSGIKNANTVKNKKRNGIK